mgnify:CR=1 FL=1
MLMRIYILDVGKRQPDILKVQKINFKKVID